jgi:hypothetical protein
LEKFERNSRVRVSSKEANKLGFVLNPRGIKITLYLVALVREED